MTRGPSPLSKVAQARRARWEARMIAEHKLSAAGKEQLRQLSRLDARVFDVCFASLRAFALAADADYDDHTRTRYAVAADDAASWIAEAAESCGSRYADLFEPQIPEDCCADRLDYFTTRVNEKSDRYRALLWRALGRRQPFTPRTPRLNAQERRHLLDEEAPQTLIELRAAAGCLGAEGQHLKRWRAQLRASFVEQKRSA